MDFLPQVVYIGSNYFYDRVTKRRVNYESAVAKIRQSDPVKFDSDKALRSYVEQLMQVEVPIEDLKAPKKSDIDFKAMYEAVKPKMPFWHRSSIDGTSNYYSVNSSNEATLLKNENENAFFSSLKAQPHVYETLLQHYETEPDTKRHCKHLDFKQYVFKMLYQLEQDLSRAMWAEPVRLSWDPGKVAFKQFDPSKLEAAPCPSWDEFLARLDYPEVFMAWVWSLFQPDLKIRQVMWLHGGGNDGKTSVISALREIFGTDYTASLSAGAEGKDWFFADVYGKGFVTYADCKNQYLISHIKIKNLTGGDPVQVEGKGLKAFSGRVRAHLVVGSNHLPQISPIDESQVSRLIKLEVAKPDADKSKDSGFEARLIAEGYAFLNKCRDVGAKYINSNGIQIDLPDTLQEAILTDCVSDDHMMLEDFVDQHVDFGPDKLCKIPHLTTALGVFLGEYNVGMAKLKHYVEAFDVLATRMKCRKERVLIGDRRVFAYRGFELRKEPK